MNNLPIAPPRLFAFGLNLLIAFSLVALTGCSIFRPARGEEHYYLLSSTGVGDSVVTRTRTALVVRLLPVEVPDYLQTRDIAVRDGNNEIVFPPFHQWAEPLDAGIRRVLARDLQASSEIREVLTDEPSPADANICVISIHIMVCEGSDINGQGAVLFKAAWSISKFGASANPATRGVFSIPPSLWQPGNYAALAARISRAVAGLAETLARESYAANP